MLDEKGRLWLTSAVRSPENPAFCKEGSSHPSAKAFPIAAQRAASADVRPGDQTAHAHRDVLRDPSPDVCGGREQHTVDERRRPGRGLAESKDVRGDGRRREVTGLDRADHGYQWQRAARRVRRAGSAGGPDKRQALRCGVLLRGAGARWRNLGQRARLPRTGGAPRARLESAGDGARRGVRAAIQRPGAAGLLAARRRRRSQRRVVVRTRERAPGELRSPQMQGPAERSRRRPASTAPRAGRCIPNRRRSSAASRTAAASKAATTPGSISSMRLALAPTRRSTPATRRRDCWR